MPNRTAEEYIKSYDLEWSKNSNFRTLWQNTADLMFPRESNITDIHARGVEQTEDIYDNTAIDDSKIMADGLVSAIIPAGQYFFQLNVSKDNKGGQSELYENYLSYATDRLHVAIFASNFLLQFAETIRSKVVFGTGNIFSEWSGGLNYKDYDIALYQILENSKGAIDTIMIKFPYTARQAVQEWGDKVGKKVRDANDDPKKENNIFYFIHNVSPRMKRNPRLEDYLNMKWESVYIGVEDKNIIDEGGYSEFPYHVGRWMKTTGEVNGRGAGTQILPQVRVLQQQMCDLTECGNKHNNPPREVLDSFEGELKTFAGATNNVLQIPSTRVMEGLGDLPYTEKIIEMQRDVVHKAFYRDVFVQLAGLEGDRRTTVEIRERILEGLRRVGQPSYRIQSEILGPLIHRSLQLMIRNGEIEKPPPGLFSYDIEYLGLMAIALSSGQARGFQQWAAIGMEMQQSYPGITDNINADEGFRHLGRSLGVKSEHINTVEQRNTIREERQRQIQEKKTLEALQAASQGYSQTTGAPESGSPAEQIMSSLGVGK